MNKSVLFSALGMMLAVQSATALAGKQIYPGAMCVRWNEHEVIPTLSHSRIFNTSSTKEMRVDCPILHQNFDPRVGNDLDTAAIGVINTNPTMRATCELVARYQIGSVLFGSSGGIQQTIGSGTHEQNLVFGRTGRHPENWYYIGCTIPRTWHGQRSGITYYSGED